MELTNFDRVPPFNAEAERAVLGSCLLDGTCLPLVMEIVEPDDFYDPRNRKLFAFMVALNEKDIATDAITVENEIKKSGEEESLGGRTFLASLTDSITTVANVEYHAQIVKDKAIHRNLITVGSDIARIGFEEDKESDDALEEAEQKVFALSRSGRMSNMRSAHDVLLTTMRDIEMRLAGGRELTGIATGFRAFDALSAGLQGGSLYILAARPAMGKTSLALNIAQYVATKQNIPVLIFTLEMSSEQIIARMLSAEAKVNMRELFRNKSSQSEYWNSLTRAATTLEKAPIYIDDSTPLTTVEIRGRCRRFASKYATDGKGLIVIDYLQLMEVAKKRDNRTVEVSEISRTLKSLAREFKMPVIALSQLSRDVEKRDKKVPQLSDLRESGAIEQDADMVMFLYREAYYNSEQDTANATAELHIAKNRSGATGKIDLVFFNEYSKFENSYTA